MMKRKETTVIMARSTPGFGYIAPIRHITPTIVTAGVATALVLGWLICFVHRESLNSRLMEAAQRQDWKGVRQAIHEGADPNSRVPDNVQSANISDWARNVASGAYYLVRAYAEPILTRAVMAGELGVVRDLLHAGADASCRRTPEDPTTPIIYAAANGRADMVRVLIDNGACVDDVTAGKSPLMIAAMRGHLSTVIVLLEKGANPQLRDRQGSSIEQLVHEQMADKAWRTKPITWRNARLACLHAITAAGTNGASKTR
jgi:hypothetical protein